MPGCCEEVPHEQRHSHLSYEFEERSSLWSPANAHYTLLLAALGSCISMTTTLYARRKGWALEQVTVILRQRRIHAVDCLECPSKTEGYVHRIERSVTFAGDLSDEQRARLQEIAHKCPVHKTLTSAIVITELKD